MPEASRKSKSAKLETTPHQLCGAPDPITVIEEEHALQLELCNVLEFLADSLPNSVDGRLAGLAVTILRNGLQQHINLEEEALFPLLRRRIAKTPHLVAVLDRLTEEHDTDEGLAIEIADALEDVADGRQPQNAELLGDTLRGFFDSQRRHIAWENQVVLPLARQVLTAGDLAEFQAYIMASRRPSCTHQSLLNLRRSGGAEACTNCAASGRASRKLQWV